jgi:lipopolysaccharide exporter
MATRESDPRATPATDAERRRLRFGDGAGSLRRRAARGTLVNAAFVSGTSALGLVKGFVLAGFLTRADYGVWGVLMASIGTLQWLKQVGIADKYVQQDEDDQEKAFQRAFTMDAIATGAVVALMLLVLPIAALVYDQSKLLLPGLLVIATVPAGLFQLPLFVHYRRMDFVRQRKLQAVEPVLGFVVAVGLAIAGAGYWALVVGVLAGAWGAALAAVLSSPFKLAFRYTRSTLKSYFTFSWPIFVSVLASLVVVQSSILMTSARLGLAAAGVVTLAAVITQFTQQVDQLITDTLYPAICAVADRLDLLQESFVKSNRLALIWGIPFGAGLALFAPDLVHFALGPEWNQAVVLLQIYGVTAAIAMIAFNWTAYFRALGDTRPIAIDSLAAMVAFLASAIPLLILFGLPGLAAGVAIQALVDMACRVWFLSRLFHGFRFVGLALRAVAPALPAVGAVLLARTLESGNRSIGVALAELALYGTLIIGFTLLLEGRLLREALGYLRRAPAVS